MSRLGDMFRRNREAPAVPPTLDTLINDFLQRIKGGVSPRLLERVWVANRCLQLNSQMIASMPLRFFGAQSGSEPAWLSSPDPVWFPNGINDAVRAIVKSVYGWGDAFLLVTNRYATGYPSAWTVLDPEPMQVTIVAGRRQYTYSQKILDPSNIVQISRNPIGLRGQSAVSAYAAQMFGLLGAGDLTRTLIGEGGGLPNAIIKSQRKLTADQALAIQTAWVEGRARVSTGVPAILPPELDFEQLQFSPKDLLLLEAQDFNARVLATAFGVPAILLNIPLVGGLVYQNPSQLFEIWWRTELRHPAQWIADALTANMLPRGSWVEFDARDALAPDFGEQVAAWKSIVADMGAASVEEFRAAVLRLPPQPEQDTIEDLITPPVAATSGQTNGAVRPVRPTQEVTQ